MKHSKLARLLAGNNRTANRQVQTEPKQPRKLGTANKANDDAVAATAAFNERDVAGQHDGP